MPSHLKVSSFIELGVNIIAVCNGIEISNNMTLKELKSKSNWRSTTLYFNITQASNGGGVLIPFIDLENSSSEIRDFNKTAPNYRIVIYGTNIEGIC